jgi:chromosome segregation ATPase
MRAISVSSENSINEALQIVEIAKDKEKLSAAISDLKSATQEYLEARDAYSLEVEKLVKEKNEAIAVVKLQAEDIKKAAELKDSAEKELSNLIGERALFDKMRAEKFAELSAEMQKCKDKENELEAAKFQVAAAREVLNKAISEYESKVADYESKFASTAKIWGRT